MEERGLALLEAVVALGLLALLILPIGSAILSRSVIAERSRARLEALTLAQGELEYLVAAPDQAGPATYYLSYPSTPGTGDTTPRPGDNYRLSIELSPYPGLAGMSQLTIQAAWPAPSYSQSQVLTTLIPQ